MVKTIGTFGVELIVFFKSAGDVVAVHEAKALVCEQLQDRPVMLRGFPSQP